MPNRSRLRWLMCALLLPLLPLLSVQPQLQSPDLDTRLFVAAAMGDVAEVADLLAKGADIEVDNYGVTPLYTACDQGNLALVTLLLEHGADLNAEDLEWGRTPLALAASPLNEMGSMEARAEIVTLLVEKGAGADGAALGDLMRTGHLEAVRTLINRGGLMPGYLNLALASAQEAQQTELIELLTKAGAREPGPMDSHQAPERLQLVAGVYRNASGQELTLRLSLHGDELLLERAGQRQLALLPSNLTTLRTQNMKVVVRFGRTLPPAETTLQDGVRSNPDGTRLGPSEAFTRIGDATPVTRAADATPPMRPRPVPPPSAVAPVAGAREWPSFRGPRGSGVLDGAHSPTVWDVEKGINVQWKTPIPGLAHSSPVVWGDRVFITTAVSLSEAPVTYQYSGFVGGGSADTRDDAPHSWRVYALDKQTGRILWERVAHEGVPRTRRHVQESQANSTPATDGTHLVVFFGSEGLYCYDLDGTLLWKKDLGPLSSGRFLDPGYEWNTAGSPIIYKHLVILQVDLLENAFVAAFDITTGEEVWRATREELPTWTTPLLYEGPARVELVTAAANFVRGYDPDTGQELWRLGKHSNLPTPSPIAGRGLIFVTSGSGNTIQPIYAIRPGANGDITLKENETWNDSVVWSSRRGGPFTPTPILYGDLLYVCSDGGVLAAYRAETGERVYRERVTRGSGYSASPVASDGKLYFPSQDGDVVVVKAGPQFERLAVNPMGEVLMATPAISEGMILVRTQHHVVAVAESAPSE